jgi:hypothetical protein
MLLHGEALLLVQAALLLVYSLPTLHQHTVVEGVCFPVTIFDWIHMQLIIGCKHTCASAM